MRPKLVFSIGVALWILTFPSSAPAPIIGTDDRIEWYEEPREAVRRLGRSVVALIEREPGFLSPREQGYRFTAAVPLHGEHDELCRGDRFWEQLAPAHCTGFLVGPDLVITANHCVVAGCEPYHFVFDFLYEKNQQAPTWLASDRVFSCREIVARDPEKDWALVRLDRPVAGRVPFKVRQTGSAEVGTPVMLMGYPRGVPLKIAGNAAVVPTAGFAEPDIYFETFLDTFGGNSGGPVLNSQTLEVEGILAVAFGETEEATDPLTGIACKHLRTIPDPADALPAWAVRAEHFVPAIIKAWRH